MRLPPNGNRISSLLLTSPRGAASRHSGSRHRVIPSQKGLQSLISQNVFNCTRGKFLCEKREEQAHVIYPLGWKRHGCLESEHLFAGLQLFCKNRAYFSTQISRGEIRLAKKLRRCFDYICISTASHVACNQVCSTFTHCTYCLTLMRKQS